MSRRSKYRPGARHQLTDAQAAFEDWLKEHGYSPTTSEDPWGVEAAALLDDFFDEYPEQEAHGKAVRRHAEAIGSVTDSETEPDDDEEYEAENGG